MQNYTKKHIKSLRPSATLAINEKCKKLRADGKKVFNVRKLGKSNQPQLLGKSAGEEILKKSGNSFIKKR